MGSVRDPASQTNQTFGLAHARRLRGHREPVGDTWHLDECSSPFTAGISTCGGPSASWAIESATALRGGSDLNRPLPL